MIIILEGPNGVGKSSLAKNLSALLGIPYRKENKPDRPGFQYYLERAKTLDDVILDRFHLGERVYPQIKQDGRVPLERWQQRAYRVWTIVGVLLLLGVAGYVLWRITGALIPFGANPGIDGGSGRFSRPSGMGGGGIGGWPLIRIGPLALLMRVAHPPLPRVAPMLQATCLLPAFQLGSAIVL